MVESPRVDALLLTCEHGGARVPPAFRAWMRDARHDLASHRGFDAGALALAQVLARATDAPLIAATTTRLLVDLNRPEGARGLFSRYTRARTAEERERLLDELHRPHWRAVFAHVASALRAPKSALLHVGVHSFTPVMDGHERSVDVGLLCDPRRPREVAFCRAWARQLEHALPGLRVRRNRPYYGSTPGLTTALRTRHPRTRYLGIELELNQRLATGAASAAIRRAIALALVRTLEG